MKYLKLYEDFEHENILNEPFEVVISKRSFDYLVACLNKVARACAKESKHLPTREPIDTLVRALTEYGNFYGMNVDIRGNQFTQYLDFQDCLENSVKYLEAIDKFIGYSSPSSNVPSNVIKPTGFLKEKLADGFILMKNILQEFGLLWAGRLGEAPPLDQQGQIRKDTPHWK
jgi:hypothetical protein